MPQTGSVHRTPSEPDHVGNQARAPEAKDKKKKMNTRQFVPVTL